VTTASDAAALDGSTEDGTPAGPEGSENEWHLCFEFTLSGRTVKVEYFLVEPRADGGCAALTLTGAGAVGGAGAGGSGGGMDGSVEDAQVTGYKRKATIGSEALRSGVEAGTGDAAMAKPLAAAAGSGGSGGGTPASDAASWCAVLRPLNPAAGAGSVGASGSGST